MATAFRVRRTLIALAVLAAAFAPTLSTRALAGEPTIAVPPAGGLTQGLAGTSDPEALAAGLAFPVESVSMLDTASQRWLVYVPGAPAGVSSLVAGVLEAASIVTIRRAGSTVRLGASPAAPTESVPSGDGNALAAPPAGGLVAGIAGTNDPGTLVAVQPFNVESVSMLDVPTQTWLTFVPGAPPFANTMRPGHLRTDSVVTLRRASAAPVVQTLPRGPVTPSSSSTPADASDVHAAAELELVQLVNRERLAQGLNALVIDPMLTVVARAHSRDMVERDYFAHTNPDGLDPFDRMRARGVSFGWAAENLVLAGSVDHAHSLLMNSPGHRDNILGVHFRRIGIGAISGGPNTYMVTQAFAD